MALKKLFPKKGEATASKAATEVTEPVAKKNADIPQQQTEEIKKMVEETKTDLDATADETQKESHNVAEKTKADILNVSVVDEKKKLRPEVRPHAFVVMPFGKKKGGDGSLYDFNTIYQTLIKPALEMAGFEPFRADEATTSGDILTDMFQELLLADMVLADLSIDNANAYYELGIRHAFRKRGIVHIQAGRAYMPFDIFNVRTLPYHITPEGIPDPDFLDKDIQAIARMTRDTWSSDRDAIHSPIFNLLTGLDEPDQRALRTPLATGFWREYNEWRNRVTIAQRQKRIGDILLLTEEITNPLIKEEAVGQAGRALANMGRNELALAQYRKGLEINPNNLSFRREEAFHLNRLDKVDEAIVKIEGILADHPGDTESIAYLGRIYKKMWADSWNWIQDPDKRLRTAFESYHWLLKSYQIYLHGFRTDLDQYFPGINALTLATILVHLADKFDDKEDPDPDIDVIREDLPELRGTLEFALEVQAINPNADYWTLVSLAELHVTTSDRTQRVIRAYRKAMTASRRNTFFLESSIQQLEILQSLEMRPEYVSAGIKVLKEELARIHKEEYAEDEDEGDVTIHKNHEGNVFLFTGYMLDAPGEDEVHFPAHIEEDMKKAIGDLLDNYQAGPDDLAITSGMAAGGDLIFIECCVERGIPVSAHLAFSESVHVRDYVSPCGEDWVRRFYDARNHPLVDEYYQQELVGDPQVGDDPRERNNRWALYSSLSRGIDKVRLIALWNDKNKLQSRYDTYLVQHMVELMLDMGGQVEILNPSMVVPRPSRAKNDKTTKAQEKKPDVSDKQSKK